MSEQPPHKVAAIECHLCGSPLKESKYRRDCSSDGKESLWKAFNHLLSTVPHSGELFSCKLCTKCAKETEDPSTRLAQWQSQAMPALVSPSFNSLMDKTHNTQHTSHITHPPPSRLQASSSTPDVNSQPLKLTQLKRIIRGERDNLCDMSILQVEKADVQSSVDKIKAFSITAFWKEAQIQAPYLCAAISEFSKPGNKDDGLCLCLSC